jgi:hypothetical protein
MDPQDPYIISIPPVGKRPIAEDPGAGPIEQVILAVQDPDPLDARIRSK